MLDFSSRFCKTHDVDPLLIYCWASVTNDKPTLRFHWFNLMSLLGRSSRVKFGTSIIIDPLKLAFTIVIFIHYKPRIAVAILDL